GLLKLSIEGGAGWTTHLGPAAQQAVAWAEVIAGGMLVLGLLSRLAALWVIADMAAAIALVTGKLRGMPVVFDSPGVDVRSVGVEYNVALVVLALGVVLLGSGSLSADYYLFWRRKQPVAAQAPGEPVGAVRG